MDKNHKHECLGGKKSQTYMYGEMQNQRHDLKTTFCACRWCFVVGLWFFVVGLWFVVVCLWLFVVGLWFFVVGCWFFFAVQNRKNCKHVIKNIRRWAKTDNIPLKTCNIMQPTSKNQRTPTKNMQHGDAGGGMLHNTHSWVLQVGYTMCAG